MLIEFFTDESGNVMYMAMLYLDMSKQIYNVML